MSALEEYRKWCSKHYRESVGFDLVDAAIDELEAANKAQVEKTIEARQETHLAIIRKREAEAEVAKYKWQLRTTIDDDGEDDDQRRQQWVRRELADLDRRWEARGCSTGAATCGPILTMRDLTLDQVREAGRFAWHDIDMMRGWCLFVSGVGFIVWNWEAYNYEAMDDSPNDDEWRHIPGCDCEFCK